MFYDRKTLKNRAKESLRGVRPRPWKVTLLYWLLVALVPGAISLILQFASGGGVFTYFRNMQELYADPTGWSMGIEAMDATELMGYYRSLFAPAVGAGLISTFLTVLTQLFRLVMSYGYANYALKLYRGETTETGDIFSGFPVAGRAIGAGIVTFLFEFLWTVLAAVLGICATLILSVVIGAFGDSTAVVVVGVLLLVAVWIAVALFSTLISYRYSLVPYFILTADMGIMEAVRASKEHMRGNYGRRFVLGLSFIGWELLNGLIVLGVICVGYFVLVFALSFALVFQSMDTVQYVDPTYYESSEFMGQLMGQLTVGMGILAVVAQGATLPIGLWLTAYRGSAYAGFFLTVTGQEEVQTTQPVTDYIPPQPSDIWDQVPPPPAFTTPEPVKEASVEPVAETPVEPEPPVEPEVPTEPENSAVEAPIEESDLTDGEAKGEE